MDPSSLTHHLPDDTPSVGELSAQFAQQKRARSPPLAFEPTSNDALAPLTSPPRRHHIDNFALSPGMGRHSPQSEDERKLQIIVEKQARLIDGLHETFADERKIWGLERERLHQRVARLEGLLKHGDAHSPARSPALSPTATSSFTSPQSRPIAKLPSIAEDENILPLSHRRDNAPVAIDLSSLAGGSRRTSERKGSVTFAPEETPTAVKADEIPASAAKPLSPPPFNYRMEAGHTPMKAPRPPTPPPQNSLAMDGIEDTPTRNNTHINNCYLARSRDEEGGDRALAGPLNLPELPHAPDDGNFSLDALSKRLQDLSEHPEERDSRPLVFRQKSPGLASPADEDGPEGFSPKTTVEYALYLSSRAPNDSANTSSTRNVDDPRTAAPTRATDAPSSAALLSPLSQQVSHDHEEKLQQDFESGGIKLKKKPSVNFGAPFGSLGAGSFRKLS